MQQFPSVYQMGALEEVNGAVAVKKSTILLTPMLGPVALSNCLSQDIDFACPSNPVLPPGHIC